LFSLAARRLGAEVISFDFDPQSVGCALELKRRFFPNDPGWRIEQGSVLDRPFVESLPTADIVYSWGVLHHTGQMWKALEHAGDRVNVGGQLFIALYNDEGWKSRFWLAVKRLYCRSFVGQWLIKLAFVPLFAAATVAKSVLTGTNQFAAYKRRRGMSIYHDWIDWLGGYPFEVAKPEQVLSFYRQKGFVLENLRTTNRLGCNQFVFRRSGFPA
jgi:2-polyprenyl-6-hydroxyphenyl methylase/3-demethylubiquinone-9 3-methyltransferase